MPKLRPQTSRLAFGAGFQAVVLHPPRQGNRSRLVGGCRKHVLFGFPRHGFQRYVQRYVQRYLHTHYSATVMCSENRPRPGSGLFHLKIDIRLLQTCFARRKAYHDDHPQQIDRFQLSKLARTRKNTCVPHPFRICAPPVPHMNEFFIKPAVRSKNTYAHPVTDEL